MKSCLIAAALLLSANSFAQDTIKIGDPETWRLRKAIGIPPGTYTYSPRVKLIELAELSHTLPNGNKVYALPQDNMPCVVPNTSVANMPTVAPPLRGEMPNPSVPLYRKPITLTKEQLRKLWERKKQQQQKNMLHR